MKEPAFPTPDIGGHAGSDGMSLRDYFAAAALQGMLCYGYMPNQVAQNEGKVFDYTKAAFDLADAMLEARKQ